MFQLIFFFQDGDYFSFPVQGSLDDVKGIRKELEAHRNKLLKPGDPKRGPVLQRASARPVIQGATGGHRAPMHLSPSALMVYFKIHEHFYMECNCIHVCKFC